MEGGPGEGNKGGSSVQFSHSVVSEPVTPRTVAHQASLSFTISQSLLRFISIESVMLSNHLILCHSLIILPLSFCIRWSKYWCFSLSSSLSKEYLGLISFRIDQLDLLAVQGILKSLLQHHNSKTSILWHSTFLMIELSHLYMTGKLENHSFDDMDLCQQSNVFAF